MRQHKTYLAHTFFLVTLVLPFVSQVLLIALLAVNLPAWLWFPAGGILCALVWRRWAKRADVPDSALYRFLPIAAAFGINMLAFVICFGFAGYQFGTPPFSVFPWLTASWLGMNFFLGMSSDYSAFPLVMMGFYGANALIYGIFLIRARPGARDVRRGFGVLGTALALAGICGVQFYGRSQVMLPRDSGVHTVSDELDLSAYRPFQPGNLLKTPSTPPDLTISQDHPRLDGATAAYPVYAAVAQAVYKGLDVSTVQDYVQCTRTSAAYQRLVDGETDIFFGAQPSRNQMDMAAAKGVEFHMTPIGREAFVFFVNTDNPVTDLSVSQIQDIYQKKITSWSRVGGREEKILPFQRPENSGSQTIMEKMMGDRKLPKPLVEERAVGMGSIINEVAAYRNYQGAIGYSFRFFTTDMAADERIRLLSINGVEPTVDNIRQGSYPFTEVVYAVTTREAQGNERRLLEWILSDQGQAMMEKCGYVGIASGG